ncbi:MAG: hypothetical protein JKY65_03505 [Planctomycetes bacterium]|nr:hypothetical protein [Planctomycetota bacterium]
MKADETTTGWLEFAQGHEEGDSLATPGWNRLSEDADALGLFGLLTAGALAGAALTPDPEVRRELSESLRAALSDQGGVGEGLSDLFESYREAKGERGPELLGRLVARQIYETYGLREHGYLGEDALQAGELLAAGRGHCSAREAARLTARLSRTSARSILGHLDGQLELVHRLSNPEMPLPTEEIDRRLGEFAPRVFAQRWPSIAKRLLIDDKRFRFVVVLWARLRGVVVGRTELLALANRIDAARPMLLVQALEEARDVRAALRAADEAAPTALLCEAALAAARPLPAYS